MKTIREIRHARLLELIAEAGSQRSFAERVGKSESQISQLKAQSLHSGTGKRRAIGDELARLFERKFDKPRGWMDTDVGVVSNVSVGPSPRGRVFVYSWAEAVDSMLSGAATGQDRESVMAWHVTPSEQAFALRVEGDSMVGQGSPSFPEGATIIVEPKRQPAAGDYVVARDPRTQRLVFRRLMSDGANWYLRPLNTAYPTIEARDESCVVGVVVEYAIGGRL